MSRGVFKEAKRLRKESAERRLLEKLQFYSGDVSCAQCRRMCFQHGPVMFDRFQGLDGPELRHHRCKQEK